MYFLTDSLGYYVYIETSGKKNKTAQVVSSRQSSTADRCLTFWYHMFGTHINTLNVYQDKTVIWSRTKNQGNVWKKGTVTLKGGASPYEVRSILYF